MLEVLISGKLLRDPTTKTGPSGKSYTTALVRVPMGKGEDSHVVVASVIAFQDQGEKLGRLRAGDAVSVSGSAKLNVWQKDGETRPGLDVTATGILSAYETRKRKGTGESTGSTRAKAGDGGPFDDPIGF